MKNEKWEMRNGKLKMENGKWGMCNGEWEIEMGGNSGQRSFGVIFDWLEPTFSR